MKKRIMNALCKLVLGLLIMLPLLLLLVQAFEPMFETQMILVGVEPLRLWPQHPSTQVFQSLFGDAQYWHSFWTSLAWTIGSSFIQVIVSILSGYVLAKYRAKWCQALVLVYTLLMLMPLQMTLLPMYRVAHQSGLLNHPLLLYMPIAFAPFGTFFMRQMILRLPDERVEFLRLEGGGTWKLLWHVIAPYCLPAALLLFALTFTEGWNLVEQPLLLVSDPNNQPLSGYLSILMKESSPKVFAADAMALLPVIVPLLLGTRMAGRALQKNENE